MDAGRSRDRLADHRRDGVRALEHDLLLDGLGGHDVRLLTLDAKVGAVLVRVRDVGDAVHERAEVVLILEGGQAHRAVGHAVVRATAGDDLVAAGESTHRLYLLGDLDGRFDRLRATGGEEDAVEVARGPLSDHIGELNGRYRGEVHRGDVGEASGLLAHRLSDLLAAVPGIDDPESGDAVEERVAIDIVDGAAFTAIEDVQSVALGQFDPRARNGSRHDPWPPCSGRRVRWDRRPRDSTWTTRLWLPCRVLSSRRALSIRQTPAD